jgi:hypothetical protein
MRVNDTHAWHRTIKKQYGETNRIPNFESGCIVSARQAVEIYHMHFDIVIDPL